MVRLYEETASRLRTGIERRKLQLAGKLDDYTRARLEAEVHRWEGLYEQLRLSYGDHLELVAKPLKTDQECQRVDIIVLKYKVPDVEVECMEHLIRNTYWPHKVTWYDNRNQSANFAKIWNHLTRISTCDYVCIADSDAFVSPGWLTKMMECFEVGFRCYASEREKTFTRPHPVGLVVPITHTKGAHTIQGELDFSEDQTPFATREQVSGFFFLFRKAMWEDIGGFEERFYLHGQDSEWMDRINESKRWRIVVRPDVFVDHLVSASIDKSHDEGELDKPRDVRYTHMIYETIRREKREGVFEPPRFPPVQWGR